MTRSSAWQTTGLLLAVLLSCHFPKSCTADSYQRTWLTYGGFGQRDTASAIALDSDGNPYMAGDTGPIYGTAESVLSVGFAVKFDQRGHEKWAQKVEARQLAAAALDASNDLYLAGNLTTYAPAAFDDAYLAKLDQNGDQLWDRSFGSTDNDEGMDVALDKQGNAYLSGTTILLPPASGSRKVSAFLAKYAPDGTQTWAEPLTTLGFYGESVAVAPDQSVYLTGQAFRTSFLAHLDSAGNTLWAKTVEFSTNSQNGTYAQHVTCDLLGNVFVVGETNHPINSLESDAFVAKFDSAGNVIWKRVLHASRESGFSGVAVDGFGNIYAAGSGGAFQGATADNYDAMWAKYDSDGNLRWFEKFGTAGDDGLTGIAVDTLGHVYLSGNNAYTVNDYYAADVDAFVARFDQVPEPSAAFLALTGVLVVARWRTTSDHRRAAVFSTDSGET
jgi:hypothetical protein